LEWSWPAGVAAAAAGVLSEWVVRCGAGMLVPLQGATAGTAVAVAGLFEWCVRLGWSWAAGFFGGCR